MNSVNPIGCYFSQAGRKVDLLHFRSLFVEFIGGNKSLKKFINVVFLILNALCGVYIMSVSRAERQPLVSTETITKIHICIDVFEIDKSSFLSFRN